MSGTTGLAPGAGGKRRVPPRPRHQELLATAARMFADNGYHATSIEDIASAMGFLKGSLYYYVRSKDDLLQTIIWQIHEDALANLRRIAELEVPPLERIRAFVKAQLTFIARHPNEMKIFLVEYQSLSPPAREAVLEARELHNEILREMIREARDAGLVSADIDLRVATIAVMGMLSSSYFGHPELAKRPIDQTAEVLSGLVVASLRPAS